MVARRQAGRDLLLAEADRGWHDLVEAADCKGILVRTTG